MQSNAQLAATIQEKSSEASDSQLAQAEANLARLSATHADNYPDVAAARELVRQLREGDGFVNVPTVRPAMTQELQAGKSRIALLDARRGQLQAELARSERLMALSPQAAYEMNNLQRDYDNLDEQYQKIRDRQLEAQVAANLEAEEKGERFTLVDPPQLPEEPSKPNRPLITLMGLISGLAAGLFLTLLLEMISKPVHGRTAVARLTGQTPMAIVPLTRHGAVNEPRAPLLARLVAWLPRKAQSRP